MFLNRLGEIRDRSFENQRYRASGLNLVVAAIILWNTVYLERAVQALRNSGKNIDERLLPHLSPLGWEHINLTGDYIWRQSKQVEQGKFRPLRMPGEAWWQCYCFGVRYFPFREQAPLMSSRWRKPGSRR